MFILFLKDLVKFVHITEKLQQHYFPITGNLYSEVVKRGDATECVQLFLSKYAFLSCPPRLQYCKSGIAK